MITVNGFNYYDYDPERKLSLWLREDLSLTGTKIGCDIGVCGSCTVLVNGEPKLSCRLHPFPRYIESVVVIILIKMYFFVILFYLNINQIECCYALLS